MIAQIDVPEASAFQGLITGIEISPYTTLVIGLLLVLGVVLMVKKFLNWAENSDGRDL